MPRTIPLLTVALGVLAAPATALAGWSAPVDLGPPADYVLSPALAFAPSGGGLLGWRVRAQPPGAGGLPNAISVVTGGHNDGIQGRLAALGAGGTPGAVRTVADTIAAGPVLDRRGRGLVLRTRVLGSDPNGNRRVRLWWSAVAPGGALGRRVPLATATLTRDPALAMDADGGALAAWAEYRPPATRRQLWGSYRVRAAWRPAGGRFGAPVTLFVTQAIDFEHLGAVTAAVGRGGTAAVVYADAHETRHGERRTVYAWTRTRRRGFGPTLAAGPHSGYATTAAALTGRGRLIVAWGTQDGGEEADKPWIVRAATLAPGARRFSAPQTLDAGGGVNRPQGDVVLAAGGRGRATVAWSAVRGRDGAGLAFPVMAATADPRGRFAPAQTLAASGAVGGVAVRADGAAIVSWANSLGDQVTDQAMAAVRPPGAAAFGAPEPIAAPDVAGPPVVAFDPATGRPTAAWPARPAGRDPSLGITTTAVLRVATRTAP
jgi:hypothetical protein